MDSTRQDSGVIQCLLCGTFSPGMKMYVSHLRLVHQQDPNFFISCPVTGCNKTFRAFPAFNTHVYRLHRNLLGLKPKYDINEDIQMNSELRVREVFPEEHETGNTNDGIYDDCALTAVEQTVSSDQSSIQLEQAKFLLMLREEKHVSQTAINTIVKHCRVLCKCTHDSLVERIRNLLPHTSTNPDDIATISEELDKASPDFFNGVDSGHLLESFAKRHMNYIVSDSVCVPTLLCKCYYTQMSMLVCVAY